MDKKASSNCCCRKPVWVVRTIAMDMLSRVGGSNNTGLDVAEMLKCQTVTLGVGHSPITDKMNLCALSICSSKLPGYVAVLGGSFSPGLCT